MSVEEFEDSKRRLRSFCESVASGCKVVQKDLTGPLTSSHGCSSIDTNHVLAVAARRIPEILDIYMIPFDSSSTVIRFSGVQRTTNGSNKSSIMQEHKLFLSVTLER